MPVKRTRDPRDNHHDDAVLERCGAPETQYFLHDGDDIVGDYTAAGSLKSCYVNSVTIDSKLLRIDGPASSTPGAEHYYHYDALGSVVNLTSGGTGQPTENTYYTNAWGEDLTQLESLTEQFENVVPGSEPNVVADRYQFTGRERDQESRLMHYRRRTYAPRAGRFLQKDPRGMPESPNRYLYLSNDPVNDVDPWGLLSGKYQQEYEKIKKDLLEERGVKSQDKLSTSDLDTLTREMIRLQALESQASLDAAISPLEKKEARLKKAGKDLSEKDKAKLASLRQTQETLAKIADAVCNPWKQDMAIWTSSYLTAWNSHIRTKLGDTYRSTLEKTRERQIADALDLLQGRFPEEAGVGSRGTGVSRPKLTKEQTEIASIVRSPFKYQGMLVDSHGNPQLGTPAMIDGTATGLISEGAFHTAGLLEYLIAHEGYHVCAGHTPGLFGNPQDTTVNHWERNTYERTMEYHDKNFWLFAPKIVEQIPRWRSQYE